MGSRLTRSSDLPPSRQTFKGITNSAIMYYDAFEAVL